MAENLGTLQWTITASDAELDAALERAYQKAQAWQQKMREATRVEITAVTPDASQTTPQASATAIAATPTRPFVTAQQTYQPQTISIQRIPAQQLPAPPQVSQNVVPLISDQQRAAVATATTDLVSGIGAQAAGHRLFADSLTQGRNAIQRLPEAPTLTARPPTIVRIAPREELPGPTQAPPVRLLEGPTTALVQSVNEETAAHREVTRVTVRRAGLIEEAGRELPRREALITPLPPAAAPARLALPAPTPQPAQSQPPPPQRPPQIPAPQPQQRLADTDGIRQLREEFARTRTRLEALGGPIPQPRTDSGRLQDSQGLRELRDEFAETGRRARALALPPPGAAVEETEAGGPEGTRRRDREFRRYAGYFLGVSALREVAGAVTAAAPLYDPLQNRTPQQQLQNARQFQTQFGSGLVGQLAEGTAAIADSILIFSGSAKRTRLTVTKAANDAAEQSLRIEQGQGEVRVGVIRERAARAIEERAIPGIGLQGFERQRFDVRQEYLAKGAELSTQGAELAERLKQAQAQNDVEQTRILSAQVDALRQTLPERNRVDAAVFQAKTDEINRRATIAQNAISRQIPALRAAAELQFGVAGEREFQAGLRTEYESAPSEFQPAIAQRQAYQQAARGAAIQEDIRRRGVTTEVIRLQIDRQPLQAELKAINEEERQALQNARYGAINIPGYGQFQYDERPGIRDEFNARRRAAEQRAEDIGFFADLQQTTRADSLRAQLARNPIGAQAIEIAGQAREESERFLRRGLPGDRDRAREALIAGGLSEQLLRQNYLDAFRGVQYDFRQLSLSNPRDTENPVEALRAIQGQIDNIVTEMKALASN